MDRIKIFFHNCPHSFPTTKLCLITYTIGEIEKIWKVKTVTKDNKYENSPKLKLKKQTYCSGKLTTLRKLTGLFCFSLMSRTSYWYSAFVTVLVCLEFKTKVGRFVPEVGLFLTKVGRFVNF